MKSLGKNVLLDLHDQILDQEDGYSVKIEAWEVDVTISIPHGIRYSLTLHNPRGVRILGYDNARLSLLGIKTVNFHMTISIDVQQIWG